MDDRQPGNAPDSAGHVPVMLERSVELLAPAVKPDSVLVDCTLGLGGSCGGALTSISWSSTFGY